jgi:hypothetical protein
MCMLYMGVWWLSHGDNTFFFDDKPFPNLMLLPEQCKNKTGPNQIMSLATNGKCKLIPK